MNAATKYEFSVGDKVKYTVRFLRSVAWYTCVPKFGIVREVKTYANAPAILAVDWYGGEIEGPSMCKVNANNLMPLAKPDLD